MHYVFDNDFIFNFDFKFKLITSYIELIYVFVVGHQWLLGMALPQDVGETDKELFRTLCNRWRSLIDLEERT